MTSPTLAEGRDVLTQIEAEARAARISNVNYTLALELTPGSATYRGDVTVTFDASGAGDTFFDFRGKTVEAFEINDAATAVDTTGYRLKLPQASLGAQNVVRVRYVNEYDHQGDGFHQFFDPEDGQEYLYSNFEPFEAHRLFPCFDQPDIKATYSLTVTAPSEWELIHNSPAMNESAAGDGRKRVQFTTTKRFSTYLVALVAGPYAAFRGEHKGIPLGFFCRKSLVPFVEEAELFEVTKQGLDFFAEFFDLPYAFGKYDQIFVPEFNAGAMENVGAVTHNEFMVPRDPPTDTQRRRRAEVILHEMAHMWFGDLVTMRWWNDLWLNESFATYMAYLAMTGGTRFSSGWEDFNSSIKNWAYRQDQLTTTHPIAGVVADTDETFLNFDGITYGKGASVLKQLVAAIGMDGFREGMRHYFRTHAYGNATLAQFMESLEAGSGRDLKEWSRLWLETSSLNTIAAHIEADGDRISSLTLTQTAPPDYPTIRPHTVEVGLVREEAGRISIDAVPASIASDSADVAGAVGRPRPSLVFPNYGDHGFFKVALDAESVAFARENMERIEDPLLRSLLWSALWNMVRDQQLKSTDFLALVAARAPREPRTDLLEGILNQAQSALARFVPEEQKDSEAKQLFAAGWAGLRASAQGDAKITWMRAMVASAANADDLIRLAGLADGTESVEGLTVDQEMRWSIATKHVAYGLPGAQARIDVETARDSSDRGRRAVIRASTSVPDEAVKASAWERIQGEGYGSLHDTAAAMGGLNWPRQRELLAPYVDRFFDSVVEVFQMRDKEFTSDFFLSLFPGYRVEQATLDRTERLMARVGDSLPMLARQLQEAHDEVSRALKCRVYAEG